jgi:hypothetical protein
MQTQVETEQNESRQTLLSQSRLQRRPAELQDWLIEQIGILAAAFGEPVTAARLRIYAEDLVADLSRAQLEASLTRARRELKFFPKISELRELAGAKAKDMHQVEANAAWEFVNRYLQRHGVVKYDLDDRPAVPPRIDYALRRIGGLWGLNQVTTESYPFKYKEFCEAYELAPTADLLTLQLEEKFPATQPLGNVRRQLPDGRAEKRASSAQPPKTFVAKKVPESSTDAQIRDRREMLRQQRDKLQSKPAFAGVL